MNRIAEFAVGLLFGWGLLVSGMTDPGKVVGFLDLAGAWDPSLAFVMGGAIGVALLPFSWARRMPRALLGAPMGLPSVKVIDRRLVLGSLAFGAGWGLAGFCPGPALVALGTLDARAFVFVAAMLAGMGLYELFSLRERRAYAMQEKLARPHSHRD